MPVTNNQDNITAAPVQPTQNIATQPVEQTNTTNSLPLGGDGGAFPLRGGQEERSQGAKEGLYGLSAAELSDPNSIQVTVSDNQAPLIVLFGPPACGKTMTLVRLTRFLQANGYAVSPIRTFRPSSDTNYAQMCNSFNAAMNSQNAANSTDRISFMLVEIMKDGRRLCQILEAPGEYYFNPQQPEAPFPTYVNTIIGCPNRKIWAIMVEPDWKDQFDRLNYVRRVTYLHQNMRPQDSTVFIYNKIDKTNYVRSVGNVNLQGAIKNVKDLFPGIFKPFENQNPVTRLWKSYNCDFVPFQTGFYTESVTGIAYQEGPEEYCRKLWGVLRSKING